MSRTTIYFHVYIIIRLSYYVIEMLQRFASPITHVLHKAVNMVAFFVKSNENKKYLPKRESTLANVQSCPSNKKRELFSMMTQGVTAYQIGQKHWLHDIQ